MKIFKNKSFCYFFLSFLYLNQTFTFKFNYEFMKKKILSKINKLKNVKYYSSSVSTDN